MGSPTLKTFNLLCRTSTDRPIPDEQLVRLERSGLWGRIVDHPDYDGLLAELAEKRGEPVIRRARSLDLETCGPKLDLPFRGARIETDVYGEGDGSFDLTMVEPLHLDTSLPLGQGLEAIMSRRDRISMGTRRKCWFVQRANAGTLPPAQQKLANQWRKEGKVIFFPDTSWLNADGNECVVYAYVRGGRWISDYGWVERGVYGCYCVLVSKE